jgi:hypothetical protein
MAETKTFFTLLKKTILGLLFFGSFFVATNALAATLYFSPSSGSKQVGKTFTVSVYVSSADQNMNAASGEIDIDSDKLEVVSISKSGSLFSLWAQEPSFSAGTVRFEGIVLNPGYKGSGGKLISFTLRAKAAGDAEVRLSNGSVLANDGNGTNILTSMGSARFSLEGVDNNPTPVESSSPVEATGVPAAPKVTSKNCAGTDGWCTGNDPEFAWALPAGVTGVSILGDHQYNSNPGSQSDGIMSSHIYNNVEDGQWYFHIRLKNSFGWGAITHYKFQVDTKNPEFFDLTLAEPINALDPKAKLSLNSKDSGSGISKYEIKIDNEQAQTWVDDGMHIFLTNSLAPGKHTVVAKAVDSAGNFLTASLDLNVDSMEAPKITEYPEQITTGETLIIKGQSYADAKVTVYVQKEGSEPSKQFVRADNSGNFKFIFEGKLSEGVYAVWAEAENDKGAKSRPSEKISIIVSQTAILKIGSLIISYLSVVVTLLALVALLVGLIWFTWIKLFTLKRTIRREVQDVEKNVHVAFDELRENARKHISTLEKVQLKRDLTKEEAKILLQLKNQLSAAEKVINKEIEQIEKDLK